MPFYARASYSPGVESHELIRALRFVIAKGEAMKTWVRNAAIWLGACACLTHALIAYGAELKVLGSTGVRGILTELGGQFEKETGHRLVAEYDVFAVLKRRIDAGDAFDVAILSPALIDDLIKQGKLAADTRSTVGRTGIGAAVRTGAPKPDISSAEALKRALLNAKSVGYPREGASGIHFLSVVDRLGIADEMKSKLKPFDGGGPPVQAFAAGEPELVVGGTTLFPVMPGADPLGGFPADLQAYIVFTAAASAATKEAEAAKALIRFLTAPSAVPVIRAKGMEPG
jgi:molybdate transport system substrate-binding protein